MEIKPYFRRANYYETDQMGFVHHSNHIKYFEEARLDFMYQIGVDVLNLEKLGIIIPNVDAYAKYDKIIKFHELMKIEPKLVLFTGARMKFEYTITFPESGEIAATGHTTHCFVNKDLRPISIKRLFPEEYKKLASVLVKE